MSNNRTIKPEELAQMFAALSNPNRLRILSRLMSCCVPGSGCNADVDATACVGELGSDLGIVPSTVSHHMKELHRAGLIHMERRGQRIECWVNPEALQDLIGFLKVTGGK